MCYWLVIRTGFEPVTHSLEGCFITRKHIANQYVTLNYFSFAHKLHTLPNVKHFHTAAIILFLKGNR